MTKAELFAQAFQDGTSAFDLFREIDPGCQIVVLQRGEPPHLAWTAFTDGSISILTSEKALGGGRLCEAMLYTFDSIVSFFTFVGRLEERKGLDTSESLILQIGQQVYSTLEMGVTNAQIH